MITFDYEQGYSIDAPSEFSGLVQPKLRRENRPGVLLAHMFGSNSLVLYDPLYGPPAHEMAKRGLIVMAPDDSGGNSWDNDDALARVADGKLYLFQRGADPGEIGLASYSMGTHPVLAWARQNPADVAAICLMLPTPGLEQTHDSFPVGLGYAIELAFGGHSGYLAALPDHDYMNWIGELADIPGRIYADLNDPFYLAHPEAGAEAFPAHYSYITDACPDWEIVTFSGGGHTLDGLDPALPAQWMAEQLGVDESDHLWLSPDLYLGPDTYLIP